MLAKLNDNVAALVLGIYLLGIIMYVVQLIFMTEVWLKGEEIDVSAITVARVVGAAWLGLGLGHALAWLGLGLGLGLGLHWDKGWLRISALTGSGLTD